MQQKSVLVLRELQLGDYKKSNTIVKHILSYIEQSPLITISPVLPEDVSHHSVIVMSFEAYSLMKHNEALNIFYHEFGGHIILGFDIDDNLIWEPIEYDIPDRFLADQLKVKEYGELMRQFIIDTGPCTFIDLDRFISSTLQLPTKGKFKFRLTDTSVSWSNMSRIFNEIIWYSLDYHTTTFNIAPVEMYQKQGKVMDLPVAKSVYKTKVLKWIPLMFYREVEEA